MIRSFLEKRPHCTPMGAEGIVLIGDWGLTASVIKEYVQEEKWKEAGIS
jgi:hypothetical protein